MIGDSINCDTAMLGETVTLQKNKTGLHRVDQKHVRDVNGIELNIDAIHVQSQ